MSVPQAKRQYQTIISDRCGTTIKHRGFVSYMNESTNYRKRVRIREKEPLETGLKTEKDQTGEKMTRRATEL